MDAEKLAKAVAKSGKSARSLSLALGKDASYVSSMIKRGYGIADPVLAAKAVAFLKGEDISSFDFKSEDFSAERLTNLIAAKKLNVGDLAERIGASKAAVYKWCQGKGAPRSESVANALAKALGVSVDYLFGFGEEASVVGRDKGVDVNRGVQVDNSLNDLPDKKTGLVGVFLSVEAFDKVKDILKALDPGMTHRLL